MAEEIHEDYYELLQVSQSADPETIDRVYRLLAGRFIRIINKQVTKSDSGRFSGRTPC